MQISCPLSEKRHRRVNVLSCLAATPALVWTAICIIVLCVSPSTQADDYLDIIPVNNNIQKQSTAYVSRIFYEKLNIETIGKIEKILVYEQGQDTLPEWLSFDPLTLSFYGVPLSGYHDNEGCTQIVMDIFTSDNYWISLQKEFTLCVKAFATSVGPYADECTVQSDIATNMMMSLLNNGKTTYAEPCPPVDQSDHSSFPVCCYNNEIGIYLNLYISIDAEDERVDDPFRILMSLGNRLDICPFRLQYFPNWEETHSRCSIISFLLACNDLPKHSTRFNRLIKTIETTKANNITINKWSIDTQPHSIGQQLAPSRHRRQISLDNSTNNDTLMSEVISVPLSEVIYTPSSATTKADYMSISSLLVTSQLVITPTPSESLQPVDIMSSSIDDDLIESMLTPSFTNYLPDSSIPSFMSPTVSDDVIPTSDLVLPSPSPSIEYSELSSMVTPPFTDIVESTVASTFEQSFVISSSFDLVFPTSSLDTQMTSSELLLMTSSELPDMTSELFLMTSSQIQDIGITSSELPLMTSMEIPDMTSVMTSEIQDMTSSELPLMTSSMIEDMVMTSSELPLMTSFEIPDMTSPVMTSSELFPMTSSEILDIDVTSSELPLMTSPEMPDMTSELPLMTSLEIPDMTSELPLTSFEIPDITSSEILDMTSELPEMTSSEIQDMVMTSSELPLMTSLVIPDMTSSELPIMSSSELPIMTSSLMMSPSPTPTLIPPVPQPPPPPPPPIQIPLSSILVTSMTSVFDPSDDLITMTSSFELSDVIMTSSPVDMLVSSSILEIEPTTTNLLIPTSSLMELPSPTPSAIDFSDVIVTSSFRDDILTSSFTLIDSSDVMMTSSFEIFDSSDVIMTSSSSIYDFSDAILTSSLLVIDSSDIITPSYSVIDSSDVVITSSIIDSSDVIMTSSLIDVVESSIFVSPTPPIDSEDIEPTSVMPTSMEVPDILDMESTISSIEDDSISLSTITEILITSSMDPFTSESAFMITPSPTMIMSTSSIEEELVFSSSTDALLPSSSIVDDVPYTSSLEVPLPSSPVISIEVSPSMSMPDDQMDITSLVSSAEVSLMPFLTSSDDDFMISSSMEAMTELFSQSSSLPITEQFTHSLSPKPTTSPTTDKGLILHDPIGVLVVNEGEAFELEIPMSDSVLSSSFGTVDGAELSLYNGSNGRPVSTGSWVTITGNSTIEGLALSSEVSDGGITDHVFVLRVVDVSGNSVNDSIAIRVIPQTSVNSLVSISVTDNFTNFMQNLSRRLELFSKLNTLGPDGSDVYIRGFTEGSVVVTFSNLTINRYDCTSFLNWFETIYTDDDYTSAFRRRIQPFILTGTAEVTGRCTHNPIRTSESKLPEITVLSENISERLIIAVTVVPGLALICLLLVCGAVLCLCYRRTRSEHKLIKDSREVFFSYKPMILPEELEAIPYRARPTIVMPEESRRRRRRSGYARLLHQDHLEIDQLSEEENEEELEFKEELVDISAHDLLISEPPPKYKLPPSYNFT